MLLLNRRHLRTTLLRLHTPKHTATYHAFSVVNMSQQRSTRALPTLQHAAASTYSVGRKGTSKIYTKNAVPLDGFLRPLPARVAAPLQSALSPVAGEDGLSNRGEKSSPAEALLETACAPSCGKSVSSSISLLPSGEPWRSELLRCETELRVLVACGVHDPPSLNRTLKTVDLFDRVSCIIQAQPHTSFIGDLLRLFRVELCRSIFVAQSDDDAVGYSDDTAISATGVRPDGEEGNDGDRPNKLKGGSALCTDVNLTRTYFEEVESLRRAKAFLTTAVAKSTSGECLLLLQRSIEDKDEQIVWYEAELEQVRRHFDQVSDECRQVRQKLEADAQEAASIQRQLQRDIQTLHVENKDVQLQLFRLRKQMAGGNSNQLQEGYRQLKLSKIAQTQSLFDEGDERVVLLVLLGQVESRVNEILDAYDNEYVLTPEALRRDLRSRMAESVVVLLEDMHFCDTAYRRLVATHRTGGNKRSLAAAADNVHQADARRIPLELVHTGNDEEAPDETDGFVAILFDQRVYEHFQARHALQARLHQYQAVSNASSGQSKDTQTAPDSTTGSMYPDPSTLHQERQTAATQDMMHVNRDSWLRGRAHSSNAALGSSPRPATEHQDTTVGDDNAGIVESHPLRPATHLLPLSATSEGSPLTSSRLHTLAKHNSRGALTELPDMPASHQRPFLKRASRSQRAEWVANILGPSATSVVFTIPRPNSEQADVVVVQQKIPEVVPAEATMQRVLRHPMEDLSSKRFLSTVEVFTGEDPVQQKLLCRMNYVDPSLAIQVPDTTNFVKVKYAHVENARAVAAAAIGSVASGSASESSNSGAGGGSGVYGGNPSLRLFKELGSKSLVENNPGLQYRAGAVSSTTASTVAFQRLNPLSPDRAPEWLLYKQLFGAYRSLTPRMIEVTTIDHLMACASERFFIRMEYRYDECLARAAQQCANLQLRRDMAGRFFKDMYVLSDFQEALVDELEARYGYPELVAKTLYEILCYLDAVVEKDSVLAAYLDVIRGFVSPTQVHYVSYMLYHLSYCWPSADPTVAVSANEVRTVFDYLYRNASPLLLIDPENIVKDYNMATRSAPLTFVSMRQFLASSMVHMEEPLLLLLHGSFHAYTQRMARDEITWETYEAVIAKCGRMKEERRSLVRFLASGLGVNRSTFASLQQLTFLAASAWSSNFWI
ncbi:conserved hypothetical protein [Leishmania mexicana MHOM/GT/2001/U1103]|uniref:Uncharacterized protein n=1 Tax=Leishmania mexicana (strain MHOM/GT/2001/U1103) TaxID=929439 RepID=E9B6H1_LEIMU|nr:conserved hypothetical protein [Leishmania mexicana MHOM/GT/2001/U1103]CBZ30843.1 conserved hypothetical protein [Leishmania mexicana MHOM/GT/2001/U1103]